MSKVRDLVISTKKDTPQTKKGGKHSFASFRRADEEEIKLAKEKRHQKELAKIAQEASLLRAVEDEEKRVIEEQNRIIRNDFVNDKLSNAFGTKTKIDSEPIRKSVVDSILPKAFIPEQAYPEPFEEEPLLNKELADFKKKINEHLHKMGFASGSGGGIGDIADAGDMDTGTAKVDGKFLKYSSSDAKWIGADPTDISHAITALDIDGATDIGAAIVDADLFIIDDGAGGTNRKTAASRIKTYIGAGAADDLVAGDAAVLLTTTIGNITIDAAANNTDIIFKGTDDSSDITMLTLDGSEAGAASFNSTVTATGFTIGSAAIAESELEMIDGITAGTVAASKVVVVDSNKDAASFRNITLTGELDAATLDISGNADIDGTLEADAYTVDGTTLAEYISDTVGAMVSSNTETGIAVTYQDGDNTLDFVVGTLNQDTTGLAGTATILATARNIGGVSFDGSANINLPGVNVAGNQDTTGLAATATALAIARTIGGTSFDGTANIAVALSATATALASARTIGGVSFDGTANINLPGVNTSGSQDTSGTAAVATVATTVTITDNESTNESNAIIFGAGGDVDGGNLGLESDGTLTYNPSTGKITATGFVGTLTGNVTGTVTGSSGSTTGNAATATALATARTIGGTSFDGTANIAVALSATTTALASARTIGGVSFDGTANINLPGVNAVGNQNTTGSAATLTTGRTIGGTSFDGSANIAVALSATATALASARTIGGVSFDGTANINLPGVNAVGNQNTTGTAAKVTVTDSTANTNFPVTFHDESNALLDDTGALRYNPSTGTLLVPNLTVAGTTTQVDTVTMQAANAVIFEGATADNYETTLSIVDPTADRTQYLINQTGYIPLLAASTTTAITSTPAELNILDGVTSTAAELNILDGVTSTAAELNILDGVTSTAAELNLIDGGTSRGTTAVASGDGILINDAGTMAMTNVDTVSTYFASHSVGGGNIVTVGALDSGSITSGFTSIDVGAGAITTTGIITGGTVEATTDTATGDNAAIGYTSAEGLILTGQGSTSDITIKNDADATVISVPTGTTNVTIAGDLTISGDDLTMGTNTSGAALIADGTNFNPVVISGDISINTSGVAAIGSGVIVVADMAANSIDSAQYVDGSIDTAHYAAGSVDTTALGADAVTSAKIADDAIDSEHYTDGSIDNAHIADDAIDSEHYADGSIDTAHIADDQITLAKMAGGTAGNLITYDASGNPAAVATGASGQILTSSGTNAAPVFASSFTPDNFTVTANNSTDETVYPVFVDGATGTQGAETDTGLTYNPSTGLLTSTSFSGNLTGTATALATGRTIGMTGDVVWTSASFDGSGNVTAAATIQANAVEGSMLNTDVISGQTALTSGLAETDELLVSDGGTIKRMDMSVLLALTDANATAIATAEAVAIAIALG